MKNSENYINDMNLLIISKELKIIFIYFPETV